MKKVLFFFCLFVHLQVSSQTILINEIVSKTSDDSADWIEIYNPSSDTISLSNYFLSDNISELLKWNDQDVMTLVCGSNVKFISYRYISIPDWFPMLKTINYYDENYKNNELFECMHSPKIIHYFYNFHHNN